MAPSPPGVPRNDPAPRVTASAIAARKALGGKISMLTAYDFPSARLLDAAGVDVLLVGDSLGMTVLGHESTLPVTMDEMLHHVRAVARGTRHALVVADMPYLSYHTGRREAVRNAGRFLKEGGAAAVKIEGGRRRAGTVRAIRDAEVPVMGHVGLTPQSIHALGGYRVQGRTEAEADAILEDAIALEDAGVFSIVLEAVPPDLAARVTERVRVPTIGIGAGPHCDGQVLVFHDFLGLTERPPRFVRRYADLAATISDAAARFVEDVRSGSFPDETESYAPAAAAAPRAPAAPQEDTWKP